MRVQIRRVDLIGGGRRVAFQAGLNVITGPISTGKTTFLRLCRSLLNTGLDMADFPRESRDNVVAVGGEVYFGRSLYSIVRPFVSTPTAKVDIAGPSNSWRVPVDRPDETSQLTYGQWLLQILGLPELRVPSAPTRPDSEPTPISINDYFLYCRLTQTEIDSSIFAHTDPFRNIKRKYVFDILYGLYSSRLSILQEELRQVNTAIRQLSVQTDAFQRFLEGTALNNRASLRQELEQVREELTQLEAASVSLASSARISVPTQEIQLRLRETDNRIDEKVTELRRTQASIDQLRRLLGQLDTQVGKLTRSIVADSYLNDLEFILCPRCGTSVETNRTVGEECHLCLQLPRKPQIDRAILIAEQDRLGHQIQETRELLRSREEDVKTTENEVSELESLRHTQSRELEFLTNSFVSDRASAIAGSAAERAALQARLEQLEDYLNLFSGLDRALGDIATWTQRRQDIEAEIAKESARSEVAEQRIVRLETEFASLVERLHLPRLEGPAEARIDRRTYLPVLYGRRFDELSSQGLQVLVNIAHAIAHHRTSIALNLGLPQILFIDGLTSNLGHEGEDLDRIHAVYDYLIELSEELGEELQIIVADNDVPTQAQGFIRLRLEEGERLIQPESS